MATEKKTKRDWLDYVDWGVKIVFGIVLAFVLTVVQEIKHDKQQVIDNSLKFGEFTKSLISDLIKNDSTNLQSDIALITLNHTIGKEDPQLIADLGARVVESYYEKKVDFNQRSMRTVMDIIQKRDSATYEALLVFIDEYNAKRRKTQISKPVGKTTDSASVVSNISNKELDKITLLQSSVTVFMQVNKDADSQYSRSGSLFNELKAKKYNTPAIEVVTAFGYKNAVKYYYPADKATAYEVQKLAAKKLGVDSLRVIKLDNSKARRGLIELWCNY
jgi:hypothetical protein